MVIKALDNLYIQLLNNWAVHPLRNQGNLSKATSTACIFSKMDANCGF